MTERRRRSSDTDANQPPRLDDIKRQNVEFKQGSRPRTAPSPSPKQQANRPRRPYKRKITHKDRMNYMAQKKASTVFTSWYTHFTLLVAIVVYTVIGALLYTHIEGGPESEAVNDIVTERKVIIDHIQQMVSSGSKQISSQANKLLKTYEGKVAEYFTQNGKLLSKGDDQLNWDFIGSLFFCSTVYTTIGYGNVVPMTVAGRLLTIIYALVGIPLFLILLTDFGKVLTRGIKFVWIRLLRCCKPSRNRVIPETPEIETVNDIFSTTGKNVHIPISLAFLFLFIYVFIGATIFSMIETWNYFDSFYFVFVSFMTIGFGDYVPTTELNMMILIFYLIFGLALTSMCIQVVGEKITDKTNQAFSKIKAELARAETAVEKEKLLLGQKK